VSIIGGYGPGVRLRAQRTGKFKYVFDDQKIRVKLRVTLLIFY
jgi:hypothetical protein